MCVRVLPACMYVYHLCAWCPQMPQGGIKAPGTGVTDGCELPHGSWESNPDPQGEQTVSEPLSHLQPQYMLIAQNSRFHYEIFIRAHTVLHNITPIFFPVASPPTLPQIPQQILFSDSVCTKGPRSLSSVKCD